MAALVPSGTGEQQASARTSAFPQAAAHKVQAAARPAVADHARVEAEHRKEEPLALGLLLKHLVWPIPHQAVCGRGCKAGQAGRDATGGEFSGGLELQCLGWCDRPVRLDKAPAATARFPGMLDKTVIKLYSTWHVACTCWATVFLKDEFPKDKFWSRHSLVLCLYQQQQGLRASCCLAVAC